MQNPRVFVQALQGTRAQILFAFLFAAHAMDVEELMTWTGRDRKTHYHHLNALCSTGMLAKQTVAHGRDIYLLGSEMLPALQAWVEQLGTGAPELQESGKRTPGMLVVDVAESKFIVPTITTLTTTSQESGKRTPGIEALETVFRTHQIVGSRRRQLLDAEWINAEYATQVIEHTIGENTWDNPIGMAITRMLDQWQPPDEPIRKGKDMVRSARRGRETINFIVPTEIVQEVAAFTGHREECPCLECTVGRTQGIGYLCQTCKRYSCECEDQDEEE